MRKLLIFITAIATALSAGCSSFGESMSSVADVVPNALDRAPFVYRPEIQQGNVVEQEQVNQLRPGLSKRQVKFLLGTPMLNDVFHANRWDYAYTIGRGSTPQEIRRLTVFFQDDRLVRIAGDMRPQPESERAEIKKEVVVTVPDWEEGKKSFWTRTLNAVGIETLD
jgi:outer membrane protein assembly factor BamE